MPVRRLASVALIGLAIVLSACGGSSATPGSGQVSLPPGSPSVEFAESAKLAATLPDSVGGKSLQKGSLNVLQLYSTGNSAANILTLFIAGLGVSPSQVGVAAAVDDQGMIQIIAAQFTGVASSAIQAQAETVAKGVDPNVTLANTTIGGKSVTTATYPNSHTGPVISYITGDTLYLVQSSDPALAEDALKQLP